MEYFEVRAGQARDENCHFFSTLVTRCRNLRGKWLRKFNLYKDVTY